MDCGNARRLIEEQADGPLAPGAGERLSAHLSACPACAADLARTGAVGSLLRSQAAARTAAAQGGLDVMWTRVRAGIEEGRSAPQPFRPWKWAWIPAGVALVVLTLVFYPTGTDRSPFNPRSFDVSVEDVESDTATVALVDKGEELPRVIWIIEDGKS
jgi:anti-sigma factor RsiW